MADHTVIAAGQFAAIFTHPLWNNGVPTVIDGFKLEGQMIQAQQAMDNSKIIALANGNTITITNNNRSGTITFNVTKTGSKGDLVRIAKFLKRAGDSQGGTLRITQEINGATEGTTFSAVTIRNCPDLIIQGNDAPDYAVACNYGSVDDDESDSE